ncbi:hypothetical protein PENTCL1PPCAC_19182, partial [Pristionchus entomophagus]
QVTTRIMPEAVPMNGGDLAELLKNSGYNFSGMGGTNPNFEMLAKLPAKVKARVAALKNLQVKSIEIEAQFYAKVHELEKQFEAEFGTVNEQRRKIVAGEYEPTAEEANRPLIHGATEEEVKELDEKSEADNGEKGVPEFWLNVLKSAENINECVQECDEPILKFLTDVTSTVQIEPPGFTIFFHFAENPYFKNTVLTKQYKLEMKPDGEEPFEYDGPAVTETTGDKIEWIGTMDVTKKVIKKKQKKGANAGKFLTKTVKADSFFNFFDPPKADADHKNEEDDEDDETQDLLRADFELGQIIRDHVIPRAVLFFTGEQVDDDLFDEFGDEGDDDEDDDDEDDE